MAQGELRTAGRWEFWDTGLTRDLAIFLAGLIAGVLAMLLLGGYANG